MWFAFADAMHGACISYAVQQPGTTSASALTDRISPPCLGHFTLVDQQQQLSSAPLLFTAAYLDYNSTTHCSLLFFAAAAEQQIASSFQDSYAVTFQPILAMHCWLLHLAPTYAIARSRSSRRQYVISSNGPSPAIPMGGF